MSNEDRNERIKNGFLRDTRLHEMTVIFDDGGVNRCLKFADPEDNNKWFQITTWANHLAFTGDMGAIIFNRTHDMMLFFSNGEELKINDDYWREKVIAEPVFYDIDTFDNDSYNEAMDGITNSVRAAIIEQGHEEFRAYGEVERIQNALGYPENLQDAHAKIKGLDPSIYMPCDWHESFEDIEMLSSRFIWSLFAINWSTKVYGNHSKSKIA